MRVATRPTARLVSGSSAVSASPSSVTVCATTWSTWTCSSLSCIIQLLEKDDTPRRPAPGVLPAERAGVGTRPCPPASFEGRAGICRRHCQATGIRGSKHGAPLFMRHHVPGACRATLLEPQGRLPAPFHRRVAGPRPEDGPHRRHFPVRGKSRHRTSPHRRRRVRDRGHRVYSAGRGLCCPCDGETSRCLPRSSRQARWALCHHRLHACAGRPHRPNTRGDTRYLSLIHISEPTRLGMNSYAVFCLKKKTA